MPRVPGRAVLGASLCLALAACGGGSSSAAYQGSTIQGQVLMAAGVAVTGATVCFYGAPNAGTLFTTPGLMSATSGATNPNYSGSVLISDNGYSYAALTSAQTAPCTSTDAGGNFSANLTSFYGPVIIQVRGGSYGATALNNLTDRASNLEAVVNSGGGGTVSTVVTPLTTIATEYASGVLHGVTSSNYATGLAHVQTAFSGAGAPVLSQDLRVAPTAGDPYDLALKGVEQYLTTNGAYSAGPDPNATELLTWSTASLSSYTLPLNAASPTVSVSSLYTSAYNAANHASATFAFN